MAAYMYLNRLAAEAHVEDLRRAASRQTGRDGEPRQREAADATIVIRGAREEDVAGLARLAALDGAEPIAAPVLVAEVDGALRAALSLADGASIADPFQRTAAVAQLLRTRARQLDHGRHQPPGPIRRAAGRLVGAFRPGSGEPARPSA